MRLLLIDGEGRVLLHHYLTVDTGEEFWCTPGGALVPGETDAEAARRELFEEEGVTQPVHLGTPIWSRTHVFRIGDGRVFEQRERYYAVRIASFDPVPGALSDFEHASLLEQRWLSLEELRSSRIPLNPPELGELAARAQSC